MASGSLQESFVYQLAHIHESRRGAIFTLHITLIVLITVSVGLRFAARRIIKARLSYDDYAIVVALVLAYGLSATTLESTNYGVGKHLFASTFDQIKTNSLLQYIFAVIYTVCLPVIKLSMILLYLRIFPIRRVRIICYCFATFIGLWSFSALIVTINVCRPIRFFWDKSIDGRCINFYALILTEGILTILTDVALLIIPMPLVWNLKIPRRQKLAVSGILLLGGFVCVTSIIRIPTIRSLFTLDPPWTSYTCAQWSIVEADIGIVCACLPTLRPLVRKLIPSRMSSRNASSSPGVNNSKTSDRGAQTSSPSIKLGDRPNVTIGRPFEYVKVGGSDENLGFEKPNVRTALAATRTYEVTGAHGDPEKGFTAHEWPQTEESEASSGEVTGEEEVLAVEVPEKTHLR